MLRCNNVEAAQGRYGNRGDDHGVAACDAHRNLDDVGQRQLGRGADGAGGRPVAHPYPLVDAPAEYPAVGGERRAPISSLRLVVSSSDTLPASSATSLTPGRPSPAERHARRTAGHRPGHRAARHRNAPCPAGSRPAAATSGPWLRAVPLRRTRCAIKPVIRHKAAVLVVRWHPMSRTRGPTRLYQAPRPGLCPISVHVGTSEHPDEAFTGVLRGAVRGVAGRLIGRAACTRWNAAS